MLSLWGREYHGTAPPSAERVSKFIPTSWRWCKICASLSVVGLYWVVPFLQKRVGMEQKANCRVLHLTFPIIPNFSFRTTVRRSVSSSPWAGKGHPWVFWEPALPPRTRLTLNPLCLGHHCTENALRRSQRSSKKQELGSHCLLLFEVTAFYILAAWFTECKALENQAQLPEKKCEIKVWKVQ